MKNNFQKKVLLLGYILRFILQVPKTASDNIVYPSLASQESDMVLSDSDHSQSSWNGWKASDKQF